MLQTLVDLGDKPASIVGGKSWIGSVEVSMVLNKWIDVSSVRIPTHLKILEKTSFSRP